MEPSRKYLQEALEIDMDYDIAVYDALFLAQAKSLEAELITSDKKQEDAARKLGLATVYIE